MPENIEVKAGTSSKEAEEIVNAIRRGCVDAFVVEEEAGESVYALQTADLPYSTLVQKMQQGAAMLNASGEVIYCNPSLAALLGLSAESVIGRSFCDFVEPSHRAFCHDFLADGEVRPGTRELSLLGSDGVSVPVRVASTTLSQNKSIIGLLVTDLTVEKLYDELTSRTQSLQDEERRTLARELHDSVGQLLAAVSMNLSQLREGLTADPVQAGMLADSELAIRQVSKEIRTISHLLHPPLLDVAGLASAIRWYADGFSERSHIAVDLKIPPDIGRLPSEVEIALFRIVQECLTNIYRHSGSQLCSISMMRERSGLHLEVRDQGHGISKSAKAHMHGLGLRSMRERVRRLGGELEVQSGEQGTTIRAIVPIRAAAA